MKYNLLGVYTSGVRTGIRTHNIYICVSGRSFSIYLSGARWSSENIELHGGTGGIFKGFASFMDLPTSPNNQSPRVLMFKVYREIIVNGITINNFVSGKVHYLE